MGSIFLSNIAPQQNSLEKREIPKSKEETYYKRTVESDFWFSSLSVRIFRSIFVSQFWSKFAFIDIIFFYFRFNHFCQSDDADSLLHQTSLPTTPVHPVWIQWNQFPWLYKCSLILSWRCNPMILNSIKNWWSNRSIITTIPIY